MIDTLQAKQLKTYNSVPPKIYGLRKIHKPGVKLRPIVSCIKSPCYKLASYVHKLLQPFIETIEFNIKNSFDFVEFINTVKLHENYILISLDVTSLFTNIPKELMIATIEKEWQIMSRYINVPKEILLDLICCIYETSYFTFEGKVYQQLQGTSMGNPASPSIANIVMNYCLNNILAALPFEISFLKLYVDDTILAIPANECNSLLSYFNGFHEMIQFTMEK